MLCLFGDNDGTVLCLPGMDYLTSYIITGNFYFVIFTLFNLFKHIVMSAVLLIPKMQNPCLIKLLSL